MRMTVGQQRPGRPPARPVRRAAVAVVVALLLAAGCSTGGSGSSAAPDSTTSRPSAPPTTARPDMDANWAKGALVAPGDLPGDGWTETGEVTSLQRGSGFQSEACRLLSAAHSGYASVLADPSVTGPVLDRPDPETSTQEVIVLTESSGEASKVLDAFRDQSSLGCIQSMLGTSGMRALPGVAVGPWDIGPFGDESVGFRVAVTADPALGESFEVGFVFVRLYTSVTLIPVFVRDSLDATAVPIIEAMVMKLRGGLAA